MLYKIEICVTPEGEDHWLVGADGRAVARLTPRHPRSAEIAMQLSASPLLQAALQNLVKSHARFSQDSDELLPEDEQPAEIREALAALRAASPNGTISFSASSQVPEDLRALVDYIGRDLKQGQHWNNVLKDRNLLAFLKGRGGTGTVAADRDGNPNVLAEFKLEDRTWLLWVEGDSCGVEPCISLAEAIRSDTYGNPSIHAPDRYRWKHPEAHS